MTPALLCSSCHRREIPTLRAPERDRHGRPLCEPCAAATPEAVALVDRVLAEISPETRAAARAAADREWARGVWASRRGSRP